MIFLLQQGEEGGGRGRGRDFILLIWQLERCFNILRDPHYEEVLLDCEITTVLYARSFELCCERSSIHSCYRDVKLAVPCRLSS